MADAEQERLNQEARTLFQLVMSEEKPPHRCQYDREWDTYAIPDYTARKVFGIKVHAGLVAPFQVGDFQTIVDPDGRHSQAFCSSVEVKAFAEQKVKAFEASSDDHMQFDRTRFTYPVFDDRLRTAVVVVSYVVDDGLFRWNGRIARHPEGYGAVAKIYRKIKDKWRLVGSQQLAIS